jgi:hypothetical protein
LEISLTLSKRAVGHPINVPEDVDHVTIASMVPYLYWRLDDSRFFTDGFLCSGVLALGSVYRPVQVDAGPVGYAFVFPLSQTTVSRIEDLRNGRKARFRVFFQVAGYYDATISTFAPPAGLEERDSVPGKVLYSSVAKERVTFPFDVGRLLLTEPRTGNLQDIEVEKSRWVEEILPGLGYGDWTVYELPIPPKEETNLGKADQHIDEAVVQFNHGNWRGSMGRSRDAIEALKPYLKERAGEAYSDQRGAAGEKFEKLIASFSNLTKSMYDFQSKLFSLLSAGTHPEPIGASVERTDAEFGLAVAMACRRYVGVRLLERPVSEE